MAESKQLFGIGGDRGFSLIEVTVVLMILGALLVSAAPVYLGYAQDAKAVEAKMLAGSLWTAVTSHAIAACGTAVTVSAGYSKAGLESTGATTPARWSVSGGGSNAMTVDCTTGAITPDGDVFTISGTASDVSAIRVTLNYTAGATPPSRLRCSGDRGLTFTDC